MIRIALIMIALAFSLPARANDIAVALTDDRVEIDAGFSGARLTLFGAVTGDGDISGADIIAVITGPDADFTIRRLERKNLIWAPGETHVIENAPALYLTNATKPIGDIAPLPDQAALRLGANHADIGSPPTAIGETESAEITQFKSAFLTETRAQGLYRDDIGGVSFKKDALFSINIDLPANTPVGDYHVDVYLYRDGALLGRDNAELTVNKVGLERRIYELAHQRPISYGVICVALSLFAGWIAALAFRK